MSRWQVGLGTGKPWQAHMLGPTLVLLDGVWNGVGALALCCVHVYRAHAPSPGRPKAKPPKCLRSMS